MREISSSRGLTQTMLASGMDFRTSEIENLIASNELNTATKRVMDFVSDFAANRKRKQEAIDIRASYTALREESRRIGKTDIENQELSKLRYRILDFIEVIKDESSISNQVEVRELTPKKEIQAPELPTSNAFCTKVTRLPKIMSL